MRPPGRTLGRWTSPSTATLPIPTNDRASSLLNRMRLRRRTVGVRSGSGKRVTGANVPSATTVERMETRKLGNLTVSLVGLGCNNFGMRMDEAATKEVVATALDEGITLF